MANQCIATVINTDTTAIAATNSAKLLNASAHFISTAFSVRVIVVSSFAFLVGGLNCPRHTYYTLLRLVSQRHSDDYSGINRPARAITTNPLAKRDFGNSRKTAIAKRNAAG